MITICSDFHQLQKVSPSEHVGVASQIQDYIPLRQRLCRALDEGQTYTVYVHLPILAHWLRDLRDYGPDVVRWEEINLRKQFRERFGFFPPAELDEAAIDEQLLALPVPEKTAASDPTGWILAECLEPLWGRAIPYQGHLADLAAWGMRSTPPHAALVALMQARLAQWIKYDQRYQRFREESWYEAGKQILLRWALRSYSSDFELRRQVDAVPLGDCSHQLDACRDVLRRYENELRQFWGAWLATGQRERGSEGARGRGGEGASLPPSPSASLAAALEQMSGLSVAELNAVEEWGRANPEQLNQRLLTLIATRFEFLPQATDSLKELERLIPPPLPTMPDETWTTEAWLSWVTTEYMPYFAWTIRNKQERERQMELANRFADWLIKAYPHLSFDQNGPSLIFQQNEIHKSLTNNQSDVVLWLVIDGLTWWQAERLSFLCTERGLGIKQMQPTLSALPSVTSISKRALAQGYLDAGTTMPSMARLFERQLAKKAPHVSVCTQHQELEALLRAELRPGIYLLLYNALDRHNHDSTGFTDDESVDGHLRLMARLADDFFQTSRRHGLSPAAFVSSDHGSTLLPSEAPVLKVPRLAYELDYDSESGSAQLAVRKGRACAIEKMPRHEELSRLEADWYLLRGVIYNLPTDFLMPKGYAAVERRPRGWTHGGATPEETVVAFMELQPEPVEVVAPTVKLEGFLRPQQTTTLRVQLINPNSLPLLAVQLLIPQLQASMSRPSMPANSASTHEIEVTASTLTSKGQVQSLNWQLSLRCGGQRWDFSGQVEVPVRRLQVSAVDELFGELL